MPRPGDGPERRPRRRNFLHPSEALWEGKGGGVLWILDGLDEVVDPVMRGKVAGWIREALRERTKDRFVVTCRFQGYFRDGVPLGADFATFHVRPLDVSQAKQFVRDWFRAAFGRLILKPEEAVEKAREKSEALLAILFGERRVEGHLAELSTNPLLLTILCIVFHEEGELPTGRAELYQHCVMVMLGSRREVWVSASFVSRVSRCRARCDVGQRRRIGIAGASGAGRTRLGIGNGARIGSRLSGHRRRVAGTKCCNG